MNNKEKLIELLNNANATYKDDMPCTREEFTADFLLQSNIIILPCKVWDKFYLVYEFGVIEEKECCGYSVDLDDNSIIIIDGVDSRYSCNMTFEKNYQQIYFTREEAEKALNRIKSQNL